MSYILDALKRADAERGRGNVPGLHTQPIPGAPPGLHEAGTHPRRWPLFTIALALGGIAAGIWVWRSLAGGERTPVVVAAVAVAPPVAPQPTLAVSPAMQPAIPQPPAVSPTAPAVPVASAAQPADPGLTPIPQTIPSGTGLLIPGPAVNLPPVTLPSPVQPASPASPASPPARTPAPASQPPATPKTEASAVSPSRNATPAQPASKPATAASGAQAAPAIVPLLSELPEEIRRPIPPLTITGAVSSENPAQRLLLVNGQVLPQGAAAAPEVMIEEIRARSSIFSFRGSRFRITY
jgi:general secretion pathway protein B